MCSGDVAGGVPRPIAARVWLVRAASLISLGGVELGATVWLAWLHRLPVLPTRLAEPPPGETSIVVIGESSAGVPLSTVALRRPDRRVATGASSGPGSGSAWTFVPGPAANLEEMHQDLAKLTLPPTF